MDNLVIALKLKDKGTMFHDSSQDFTLSGGTTVAYGKRTLKVANAIKAGILIVLESEAAYKAACAERGQAPDPNEAATNEEAGYSSKTVAALKELCAIKEIDVTGFKLKTDYVAALEAKDIADAEAAKAEEASKESEEASKEEAKAE